MTLIKSISGIRGTIGGKFGEALTPLDIMKLTMGYAIWLKKKNIDNNIKIIIGRDARVSGGMVNKIVVATLQSMGIDVVDGGVCSTPTVEVAVKDNKAQGGIIITASHNPKNWNALKLLNENGEFLSAADGNEVIEFSESQEYEFAKVDKLGKHTMDESLTENHIKKILSLPGVDVDAISDANFTVAIDGINSVGGIAMPKLLEALGVKKVVEVYCEPTGLFQHNAEPLPEHLNELSSQVVKNKAHVGFAVDPDVDRLAIICEDGEPFGEEYTLVAVADYILQNYEGNSSATVSNLSSSQALADVTEKYGGKHYASAVGEVNVVEKMKEVNAIIGGEGNGGVIYPEMHYGRDALTGAAIFLTYLAKSGKRCSSLKKTLPEYTISKNKIELTEDVDLDNILNRIANRYKRYPVNDTDGVKIFFDKEWVHLRKSNTEPIIRIYSESDSAVKADNLAKKLMTDISEIFRGGE